MFDHQIYSSMKNYILIALTFVFMSSLSAQTEISYEASGNKVIKGFMTRADLDTAFTWFKDNQKGYVPQAAALDALKKNKDSVNLLVFGGTWCDDTRTLLPKFFSLADAAGISPWRITLVGVDRNKKTLHHLTEAFGITNVPTFIVMKNGKEIGRVVEYGKYGMFDKELGEIITNFPKK
jgi:thiol-disulfide isomerase/thioredoxin